ncbi:MAG TPA: hypothetical protein VMX79_07545 [bacterium]|nr:hypothetical protein [bacterium]
MIRKYKLVGDQGIMPETKVIKPGEVVELDDGDPRVAIWLEDGVITPEHSHKEPKLKEDKPESKGEGK